MRLIWITDIHLNFLESKGIENLLCSILNQKPDALLIGGDIGDANTVVSYLTLMESRLSIPIYFVLGNHDYYHGSIEDVQKEIRSLENKSNLLNWLDDRGLVELTSDCCLFGHGGWGDGRSGDYWGSEVALNDFFLIWEQTNISKKELLDRLNARGDEAAVFVRKVLLLALKDYKQIFFLTHVPPFWKSAWYKGQPSDKDFAPFFVCKAVGDALFALMKSYPDKQLIVLCGHTHGDGMIDLLPNLSVYTGGARYKYPSIQKIFEIG